MSNPATMIERSYARRTIQINIELSYRSFPPIIVKTRDISNSGIFITVDNAKDYAINDIILLRYKNPFHNSAIAEKKARIMRHEDSGFAAMLIG